MTGGGGWGGGGDGGVDGGGDGGGGGGWRGVKQPAVIEGRVHAYEQIINT